MALLDQPIAFGHIASHQTFLSQTTQPALLVLGAGGPYGLPDADGQASHQQRRNGNQRRKSGFVAMDPFFKTLGRRTRTSQNRLLSLPSFEILPELDSRAIAARRVLLQ